MEQIHDIISSYNDEYSIEKAFKVSTLMNVINTKNMNITGKDMRTVSYTHLDVYKRQVLYYSFFCW